MKPNLFDYATSELSQDAFFCWLLHWSQESLKEIDSDLFKISKTFLNLIHKKIPSDDLKDIKVNSIEITNQYKNIDFFARINNEIIILFEDKIKTKYHSNQLERYAEIIYKDFPNHKVLKVYLKSDYVWNGEKNQVKKNDFVIIDIVDLNKHIFCLNSTNCIYTEFRDFINKKVLSYNEFRTKPCEKWNYNHQLGFYHEISLNIEYKDFGRHYRGKSNWFIINWKANYKENCNLSLEIFSGDLVIRGHVDNPKIDKKKFFKETTELLLVKFHDYNLTRIKGRSGKIKTLVRFNNFPICLEGNGLVDVEKTISLIKEIKTIFVSIK